MLQKLRNRGSSETLNPGQISKADGTQAHKLRGSSSNSDSPFKKNLGALKRFSLENDGEDDFASPKRVKKPIAKPFKKQPVKKAISKKSSSKKISNPILKRTKDNFKNLDVHPEHLQMALALSKSTFAQEYPESEREDKEEDLPTFLFPQQIPRVTTFLEKYGFKSNKNKLYPECSKNNLEATKIKKSKFRFLTPALYKRTKEDRESLINSKVSLIINQHNLTVPINTEVLEETNSAELEKYLSHNRCWDLNHTMDANEFIVASLNLSPSKQTMGCLLRNWDEIAGRDKSPERFLGIEEKHSLSCDKFKENDQTTTKLDSTVTTENSSLECDNSVVEKEKTRQCLSPDLFDDDDDLEYTESLNATPKTSGENFQDEKLPSSSSKSQPVSKITYSLSTSEESIQASPKSPTIMFKSLSQSSVMKTSTTEEFTASFIDPFKLDQEINQIMSESETIFKKRSPKQSKVISSKTSSTNSTSSISSKHRPMSPCIFFKSSQSSIYSNNTTPTKVETMSVSKQSIRSKNDSLSSVSSKFHTEIISPPSSIIDLSQGSSSNDSFKAIAEKTNHSNKSKTRELSSKFESETFGSYSGTSSSFRTIEKDSKGIAYFESFYDPTEEGVGMIDSFVDLISSDEDDHSNKNRDVSSRNSHEYTGKLVETENAVIEFENVDKFDKSCSNRMSLITKHSTFDSGNISLDYNHTTSLNVTDYVMDILNSQDDTDNRDEAVTQIRSSCSQESIEILSDEELNYSSRFSAQCKNANLYDLDNFDDCIGADFADEDTETIHSRLRNKYRHKKESTVETVEINNEASKITIIDKNPSAANNKNDKSNPIIEEIPLISTPEQIKPKENVPCTPSNEESPLISTPKQIKPKEDVPHTSFNLDTPSNNIIIKTINVTPMLDYDAMDTPNVRKELDKFGIKPVKRRRGVDLLKYIYETTHPVVDIDDLEHLQKETNEAGPVKKRKLGDVFESHKVDAIKIVGDELIKNEKEDDLLFERKFSKRLPSCRIPLQIAWYNFLCCNPGLKENILFYEPIHLEVVHSMFKEQSGCNFHVEDLITFLDRKCITFRTIQTRKKKKPKKAKS